MISDAELDWQTERQARFAASNVLDALAPTNFPWSNPAVLRAIVDEGGANLVRGGAALRRRRLLAAAAAAERRHARASRSAATSPPRPGSVVLRTEVFELIQYKPTTDRGARGAAAVRPADDQQVLHPRPRARPQHGRVPRRLRPAGLRRSRGAIPTRRRATSTSTPTPTRCSRRATPSPRSPASRPCTSTRRARAGSSPRAPLGHLAAEGELGEVASLTLFVCALDNERAGDRGGADQPRSGRRRRRGVRPARLPRRPGARRRVRVAAAQRPGLELRRQQLPARAQSRRPSTSSTGTRTRCAWPPACTATSCDWRSTTR